METNDGYEEIGDRDVDMLLHFQLQLQALVFPIPCSPTSLYSSIMSLSNSWKRSHKRSPQAFLGGEIEELEEEEEEEDEPQEKTRLVGTPSPNFQTFPRMTTNGQSSSAPPKASVTSSGAATYNNVNINRPVLNNAVIYDNYPRYNGADLPDRGCFGSIFDYMKHQWSKQHCNPLSWLTWLLSLFPILVWLPNYQLKKHLSHDLVAGFTVAVMHIPQGMAYAQLANLPPIIGIYMGFFPVIMYSLVGTSRHVSIGTFAIVCLMTGKVAAEKIGDYAFVSSTFNATQTSTSAVQNDLKNSYYVGETQYSIVEIATAISFSVGIWQMGMGFLRLGSLSLLLSNELVSGFTTGAAVHVLTSQVKSLLGLTVPKRTGILKIPLMWIDIFDNIDTVNFMALGLSAVTFSALMIYNEYLKPTFCKNWKLPLPVELITVVIGTMVSYFWKLHETYGIDIVNHIPTGFPTPVVPPMKVVPNVIFDSFIIAVVAYVVTVSMAKLFAYKHNYTVQPNQELFANGASNLVGSCFSCAPISASLSRSLIQEQVGGKTQLAGLFSCSILVFVLLWLGPYFQTLPSCILSSMIIVALKGMLVQVHDFPKAWRASVMNGGVWIASFVATVVLDIEYGLGVGLCLSIALLVLRSNKPQLFVVGSYNDTDVYIDIHKSEMAKENPELRVIKCTGSLNFATMEKFLLKLRVLYPFPPNRPEGIFENGVLVRTQSKHDVRGEEEAENNLVLLPKPLQPRPEHWLILDFSSVSAIDPAAVKHLGITSNKYAMRKVQILISGVCDPVLDMMSTCELMKDIEAKYFFPHVHDAVVHAKAKLAALDVSRKLQSELVGPTNSQYGFVVPVVDIERLDPLED